MRCVMLRWALYMLGLCVGLLALVQLPLEFVSNVMQRWLDELEVEYWLAVIERKTRRDMKRRGVQ